MKKRKILILNIIIILISIFLISCSNNSSNISKNNIDNNKQIKIGVCQLVEHSALDSATKGFVDVLKEKYNHKIKIDVKLAQGETNNCALIINDFVAQNVDLIMANATPALQAAVSGTNTIPILGTSITEYGTALSIDNFNGTVGGNISGTSDLAPLKEQAKMFIELLPNVKNVGLLYCSAEANSLYQIKVIKEELNKLGIKSTEFAFSDSNDLATITQNAVSTQDAIYIPTDNTAAANTGIIDNIARVAKIPIIAGEEGICSGCGIATLAISYNDLGRKTGEMAIKILEGENISNMPIEYAPNVTKKYNKTICDELGIEIPKDYIEIK